MARRRHDAQTSVVIRGNVNRSVVAAGNDAVIFNDTSRADDSESILEELKAIQQLLIGIGSDSAIKAVDLLQIAHEEAAKPTPDKSRVGSLVQTAIEDAETIDRFATIAERILPRVTAIVRWLGQQWLPLLAIVQRHAS